MNLLHQIAKYSPSPARAIFKFLWYCRNYSIYKNNSFAQEGEDLILMRIFGPQLKGVYVDVGAHHPKRFSNTFAFYQRGWNGINIDAMPGSMELFQKVRPKDINLEIPIMEVAGELDYYQFDEPALNGFSAELSQSRDQARTYKIKNVVKLKGLPLKTILATHLPKSMDTIDFLSVDVEGLDLAVLRSNDWIQFRPRLILVECLRNNLKDIASDPVTVFLDEVGYQVYAKCVKTVFFMDKALLPKED